MGESRHDCAEQHQHRECDASLVLHVSSGRHEKGAGDGAKSRTGEEDGVGRRAAVKDFFAKTGRNVMVGMASAVMRNAMAMSPTMAP